MRHRVQLSALTFYDTNIHVVWVVQNSVRRPVEELVAGQIVDQVEDQVEDQI